MARRPFLLFSTALLLATAGHAQRTLADLQKTFGEQVRKLRDGSGGRDQERELMGKQAAELEKFVADEARGDDRWNGRLMLADLQLLRADRAAAGKALAGIDTAQAPPLLLLTAAALAERAGVTEQRTAWIDAALAREAPFEERMAMARLLLTLLHEKQRGEQLFTTALAAAKDDEQRAAVRWHQADTMRDREDVGETAAYDALKQLATDLPKTYFGGVARDRLLAMDLQVGKDAIPFACTTTAGKPLSLAALRGKVVVLWFWSAGDPDSRTAASGLRALQKDLGDDLVVLAIALDGDVAAATAAAKDLAIEGQLVVDGKGVQNDLALRWNVEAPALFVIGRDGRVAGLGLQVGTQSGRKDLADTVTGAARAK